MNTKKWVAENTLVKVLSGSRLYGTHRPDSDYDYRGVCAMPCEALLGLEPFEQYQDKTGGMDVEIYGLSKFVKLALENNPNILDTLFAPPDKWLIATSGWKWLYSFRHSFLSQKLRHTFSGYAYAQLKRLEGHRKWLVNPPDHQPVPEEFGCWLVNGDNGGQRLCSEWEDSKNNYRTALNQWNQYKTWLAERNPKRAETERKAGYDTKNAAHLVRLLLKAKEILTTCDYNPVLTDNHLCFVQQVLAGEVTYENLIIFANNFETQVKEIPTDLPHSPNYGLVHEVLMGLNAEVVERWTNN